MTYSDTRWGLASLLAVLVFGGVSATLSGVPSVYPTGTTIFHPDKTWSGYTAFITPDSDGVILIDMNGRVVKQWLSLSGAAGGPARILPGGYVIAGTGNGLPHQEAPALVQLDWDGKEVWRFDRAEQIPNRDGAMVWSARQHHDWQRPGYAAGYFAPGVQPAITNTPTLVLTHSNVVNRQIGDRRLEDDRLIEVSWDGKILWDWRASDHADEFGFSADARSVIRQRPRVQPRARQRRLAAHQRGVLRRPQPLVRRGRRPLRTRQRDHQQP